jgi:Tol biopolymer transport system component
MALAYGANQGGKTALGVLRVNPDGSPGTNTLLTHAPDDGDNLGPAWSPDGKTLAFQSNRGSGAYQVYTMPADGGPPTPVAGQPAVANFPAWSPDGKTLVFAGGSDRVKRDLWVAPVGGKAVQISNTGTDVSLPRWQRDGKAILFLVRTQGSATHNLATIAPDGTGQRNLTTGEYEDLGPAISPDGAWVAFFSNRPTASGGNASGRNNEVYVMPRDASSVTNVTETGAGDVDPSWAPDSQHLVFASGREGAYRLYVTSRDGATVAPLTGGDGDYNDTFPAWSPAK